MDRSEMTLRAHEILEELLDAHPGDADRLGLVWFELNARLRTSAGRANSLGRVQLNPRIYAEAENERNFDNTVRHEIAHVVVGTEHGHDGVWRRKFEEYGGNGKRCHSMRKGVVKVRRRTVPVECADCGQRMNVGMVRANRMARGTIYRHRCGGEVKRVN